jgi:hypothetical protein
VIPRRLISLIVILAIEISGSARDAEAAQPKSPMAAPPGANEGCHLSAPGRITAISQAGVNLVRSGGRVTATSELPAAIRGAPYSAVGISTTVQILPDGNRITHRQVTRFFRDSQGRTRMELVVSFVAPFVLDAPINVIVITDPIARQRFILHPAVKRAESLVAAIANQHRDSDKSAAPELASDEDSGPLVRSCTPEASPSTSHSLGTKMISGLKAVGQVTEVTIDAGKIGNEKPLNVTSEEWLSEDLGVVLSRTQHDPLIGDTTYRLEQIERTEPDSTLFRIPTDYVVQMVTEEMMPVIAPVP